MTFLAAEGSTQDSEPRELVVIARSDGPVYYLTSASSDITYNGQRYTALALERGEVAVTMPGEEKELILTLPIDHALCRRWTQQAVPPRKVTVTVYRQNGGETEQIWIGDVTSMAAERGVSKFRVPSRAGEWMLRSLPSRMVGTKCPFVLYDSRCLVSREGSTGGVSHKVVTTVISVSGRVVTASLLSTSRNGTWSLNGELVHVPTGERMTVNNQADLNAGVSAVAQLTMQAPIVGMRAGDSIEVYAGCDWTIATCNTRFGNRQNFGGFNAMPLSNPFVPGSGGIRGF